MQNAVKHASPTQQWISMRIGHDADPSAGGRSHVEFSIRDDGVGFDSTETFVSVGLMHINDRLEAVGGAVSIASAPGRGTQISGHVPLPRTAR